MNEQVNYQQFTSGAGREGKTSSSGRLSNANSINPYGRVQSLEIKRLTAEQRARIQAEADPVGFLISVCKGDSFVIQNEEGGAEEVMPSLNDRITAAIRLMNKIVPDMRALEISGEVSHTYGIEANTLRTVIADRLARSLETDDEQGGSEKDSTPVLIDAEPVRPGSAQLELPLADVGEGQSATPEQGDERGVDNVDDPSGPWVGEDSYWRGANS